jgi:hypothetical protein
MTPVRTSVPSLPQLPACQTAEITVGQLVGQVYEAAPPVERGRMLEYLMQPLGVLAMVVIANGVFAKIRFRSGWPNTHVRLEDVNQVQAGDISALVDRVQQVSSDAIDGLAALVSASPVMASTAAAVLLVAVLVERARSRRAADLDTEADFSPPH